jgi:cytochrome bd-type quinol oxidase subunit 2
MVRHSVPETYENDTQFDLTYMVLVFITFLPTLILPWFYAHWILIGKKKLGPERDSVTK